jgi:hypothetical protein
MNRDPFTDGIGPKLGPETDHGKDPPELRSGTTGETLRMVRDVIGLRSSGGRGAQIDKLIEKLDGVVTLAERLDDLKECLLTSSTTDRDPSELEVYAADRLGDPAMAIRCISHGSIERCSALSKAERCMADLSLDIGMDIALEKLGELVWGAFGYPAIKLFEGPPGAKDADMPLPRRAQDLRQEPERLRTILPQD